jgi:hypothetical protein
MAQPPGDVPGQHAVRAEQVEPPAVGGRHAGAHETGAI